MHECYKHQGSAVQYSLNRMDECKCSYRVHLIPFNSKFCSRIAFVSVIRCCEVKFTIVSLIALCFSKFVRLSLSFAVSAGWFSGVWCYNTFGVSGTLYVMHFAPVHCRVKMGRNHNQESGFQLKLHQR